MTLKRETFVEEMEKLGLESWILKNNKGKTMMVLFKWQDEIAVTISEHIPIKFDFDGSRMQPTQRIEVLQLVIPYVETPIKER